MKYITVLLTSKFPQIYGFSFEHLLFLYQVHCASHEPAVTKHVVFTRQQMKFTQKRDTKNETAEGRGMTARRKLRRN